LKLINPIIQNIFSLSKLSVMLKFYATTYLNTQLNKLTKKTKNGFLYCKKDLSYFFNKKTFEEVWECPTLLKEIRPTLILKKSRIQDSFQKKGVSSGYRIIYIVDENKREIILLHMYPKQGKYAPKDWKKEVKEALELYTEDDKANRLTEFSLEQ